MAGGLLVAALRQVDVAEVNQRAGPPAGRRLAEQGQGLLVVVGGLLVAALLDVDDAEVAQRAGLTGPVAGLRGTGPAPAGVVGGLLVAALPPVRRRRGWSARRLGGAVAGLAGGPAGVAVDGDRLGVMTAGLQ